MPITNLPDGQQSTVAAAITAAAPGDTLVVPAGSWTWTAGVTINKALTLQGTSTPAPASPGQGPGTSSSFITRGSGLAGATPLILIQPTTDVPVRVTGFNFNQGAGSSVPGGDLACIQIIGGDTSPILKQIRIDNCAFVTGSQVVWWLGGAYGVTDHCSFLNVWICVIVYGGVGDLGDLAWARNDYAAGGLNFPFTEDCTFTWNLSGAPGSPWATFHQQGGRSVTRHCTIDSTGGPSGMEGPTDLHGNQNYWRVGNNNMRSTIRTEFYNNTIKFGLSPFRMMDMRGGSHLVHDNALITTDGSTPNIADCRDEEDDPNAVAGFVVRSPVTWPCEDQVTASFFWNNTLNGNPYSSVGVGTFGNSSPTVGDPFYIKVNRDFWLSPPSATTTTTYPLPPNGPTVAQYPSPYAGLQITSYTTAPYPHPLAGGAGGTLEATAKGSVAPTASNVFSRTIFRPDAPVRF